MASQSVLAAITGAGVIAAAKFAAAAFGGSSSMFAEGVRAAVSCGNSALLAVGQKRSAKPPDRLHPFGYGMELYFWSLMVATVLFVVAGGATIFKGVSRILDPQELTHVGWSYAVLGVSLVLATRSLRKAWKEFQAGRGDRTFGRAVQKAKDPTTLTVLFDNAASLIGLVFAVAGLVLAQLLDAPVFDGIASVIIGLLMAAVAVGLAIQCKQLLVGESATAEFKEAVQKEVEADAAVEAVDELLTMHLSPKDVLVTAVVRFRPTLSAAELVEAVDRVVKTVREKQPEVHRMFVQPHVKP